jgi:TonB family protein
MLASDDDTRTVLSFSLASDIVELVIFTTDDIFLQTLREAVGGSRRLWHVPSSDKVSDLLLAGQVGILVLDVQALPEAASVFVTEIKRQFPELVVIVAGNREAETSLANLISAGVIYRFIHKPMSPGRAKLFVDAAVKKYDDQRKRLPVPPDIAPAANRRVLVIGVATGALVIGIIIIWARHGYREGGPPGDNALDPYTQELAHNPANNAARDDAAESRERLLARAENALLEERLDEAAAAIDAARKAGVDGGRVAFLTAQLAKSRAQLKGAMAQAHLRNDLQSAAAASADERTNRFLDQAAERMKEGRLIDPEQDSARFYVAEALQIDPNGDATQAARETLARALLAQAHIAIDRRDFAQAASLLDAAGGIAADSNVQIVQQLLSAARKQADIDAWNQLLKTAEERLRQDRLIEPADDSAKYYLFALRSVNPGNAGLAPALQDLGQRLVAKARQALKSGQYGAARSWLDEADAVGYSSADSSAALREVEAATNQQHFLANVISANELTLVKSVKPVYPTRAEHAKTEGWVELDFTVTESGDVKSVTVRAAKPAGVFDSAAIAALSQWRYKPVLEEGKPTAQHCRIRIRFALTG